MIKTTQGVVHGKTIELDEDLGIPEGQQVQVQVKLLDALQPTTGPMSKGLAKVYAILGERYDTGATDTAARHDEHQPRNFTCG